MSCLCLKPGTLGVFQPSLRGTFVDRTFTFITGFPEEVGILEPVEAIIGIQGYYLSNYHGHGCIQSASSEITLAESVSCLILVAISNSRLAAS